MQALNEKVLGTVQQVAGAATPEAVVSAFSDFIAEFGFTGFLLGHITDVDTARQGKSLLVTTWPETLMRARMKREIVKDDPVIGHLLRSYRPFSWRTAIALSQRPGGEVAQEVQDYGLQDGYIFPMMQIDKPLGAVSIGGAEPEINDEHIVMLQIVCSQSYFALEQMLGPFPDDDCAALSALETDVLHYAACGKTSWETAMILDLSEPAVKHALLRARKKLDAANTAHAIAVAMRRRLIY